MTTANGTHSYLHHRTAWLPGVGLHCGKPAGDLRAGDRIVWSFGSRSTVVAVREQTDDGVIIIERSDSNGRDYERHLTRNRIVAIEGMPVHGAPQPERASHGGRTLSYLLDLLRHQTT